MKKVRVEVVDQLATDALEAMEECDIPDLQASEVLSACFTATMRVCKVMLEETKDKDRIHNIDSMTDAIGKLYAILPKGTVH